ncbi:MAG: hypothetical protein N2691_05910 [Patescibacteria group bacterium]|nr:hypothetical protein [Patescibacteria group bacterium]
MDQHPVPRQITTFEFKLIGFMTLRQFLYLAVSLPAAYVVFQIFPIKFIGFILAFLVGGAGVVTAFVPIYDRSLDVWVKNLWKRLQAPTQYYYHKKNDPLYFLKDLYFLADPHHMLAHVESREKLSQYLAMTRQKPKANYRKKQVGALLQASSAQLTSTAPIPVPGAEDVPAPVAPVSASTTASEPPPVSPANPFAGLAQSIGGAPLGAPAPAPATYPAQVPAAPAPVMRVEVQEAPPSASAATEAVPTPVVSVPAVVVAPTATIPSPPPQPASPPPAPPPAKTAPPVPVVIPPTHPFFMGVVKNKKKIPLPGIMIYVKDSEGKPQRILKTNPHGIFATFNPLPPGEYTFEIKDPNGTYFFDTMKVAVQPENPHPLEFHSRELL